MTRGRGIPDEDALNIYTDGSSYPNKQRAAGVGVRFVWTNESGDEELEDYAPTGWRKATVDEMEIEACTVALKEARRLFKDMSRFRRAIIFSDSMYVADNFRRAMKVWPNQAWRGASGVRVENIDLWKKLRREVNSFPIRVDMEWMKGHKSNPHNRAADKLAKKSASMPFNEPISISDTTKKWSKKKTKRGCVPIFGQTLKIRIISREYKKYEKTFEYRYEVIDPTDSSFGDVDFVRYDQGLSRNKCFLVRLGEKQRHPRIEELIEELDPKDYRY